MLLRLVAALMLLSAVSSDADAQRLTIEGDRFVVDGTPRFLTFISMFGAMDAPEIDADLRTIRELGFDGFRIWPNLYGRLFNRDGSVKPEGLARLKTILDSSRKEGLIADVTFTYEHTRGLKPAGARRGIVEIAEELRGVDNLLFDIQNERNVPDRRHMPEEEVANILAAIRSVDRDRLVVASNSPLDPPAYAASFSRRLGLDATAYHEPRTRAWYTLTTLRAVVSAMKANGLPAYLQEPMRAGDMRDRNSPRDRAEFFIEARANAKLAGAAAWCFHTDVALDYRSGPARLEDRLRQRPQPEWAFVSALRAEVDLARE